MLENTEKEVFSPKQIGENTSNSICLFSLEWIHINIPQGENIMEMNLRETWTVVHGMVFGFIFLLGFSGALYMI